MAELGQSSDPKDLIPGVPESIENDIGALRDRAGTVEAVGRDLERVDTGTWIGTASAAFHDAFGNEPPKWFRTCDVLSSSATALDNYVGTLRWAQSQAGEAIRLWDEGERATSQARAEHADAAAETDGADAPSAEPFDDPGEQLRQQARELLDRAREQLREVGDTAAEQIAGPGKQGDGQGWLADVGSFITGAISGGDVTTSGQAEANGPNADWQATGPSWSDLSLGSVQAHANLADASAQGRVNYGGAEFTGNASTSVGAQGSASAGITQTGLSANANGSVGARASAGGQASYGLLDLGANASAFAGAEAGAGADIGSDGVNLNANAFAGAKAEAGVSGDVAGIGAGANAEAWAGAGVEADLDVGMENGKFTIGGNVGAAVGVGGSVGTEITIDPAEVASSAGDAADAVGDAAGTARDYAGDKLGDAADTVSGWIP